MTQVNNIPNYISSYNSGLLQKRIEEAFSLLSKCSLCPRRCSVNRLKAEAGFCKSGLKPKVYSYLAHHGEEPPVSAEHGSGAIFFSNCNMSCVYCQNYRFSQLGEGREVEIEELADFMLKLQAKGCHNINLVTPTHVMPQILKALSLAIPQGLNIPLVYNTSGYELPEVIQILEGIVDVYLADMRYADNQAALKYSSAADYPRYNQACVKEMHRQVGIADIDNRGVLKSGLIIRHLVLPGGVSGTEKIMRFIAKEISIDTYVSLMSQYFPCYQAAQFSEINRRVSVWEYEQAKLIMEKYNLHNGWLQDGAGPGHFAGTKIEATLE